MDGSHFDALTRTLTAPLSRRVTLGGLATGLLLSLGLVLDESPVLAKKKKGKKKKKNCPFGRPRCGNTCCLLEETCQEGRCKHRCADGVRNAGESDTDCGRVCDGVLGTSPFGRCGLRKRCAGDDDCRSALCREPQPGAGLQCVECLQDTDCGGLRCLDNFCFPCAIDADCPRPTIDAPDQRFCVVLTNVCPRNQPCVCRECRRDSDCPTQTPHCQLGTGTPDDGFCFECLEDADCPLGQLCNENQGTCEGFECAGDGDCPAGEICDGGTCVVSCTNGILDGNEMDIDCGGPNCPKCADGKKCRPLGGNGNCESGICGIGNVCTPVECGPTGHCCSGVRDGDESDVDCGGSFCPKCQVGKGCRSNTDCVTFRCSLEKLCLPPE